MRIDSMGRGQFFYERKDGNLDVIRDLSISFPQMLNQFDEQKNNPNSISILNQCNRSLLTLIECGVDAQLPIGQYGTYLHLAVVSKNVQIVNVLINSGINVNKQDADGNTPLHLLFMNWQNEICQSKLIADILMQNGCDPNVKNNYGWCALHLGAIKYAVAYNCMGNGKSTGIIQQNDRQYFNFNKAGGINGQTPLHLVMGCGVVKIFYYFIDLVWNQRQLQIDVFKQSRRNLVIYQMCYPVTVFKKSSLRLYKQFILKHFKQKRQINNVIKINKNLPKQHYNRFIGANFKQSIQDRSVEKRQAFQNNSVFQQSLLILFIIILNKHHEINIAEELSCSQINVITLPSQFLKMKKYTSDDNSIINQGFQYNLLDIIGDVNQNIESSHQFQTLIYQILILRKYKHPHIFFASPELPQFIDQLNKSSSYKKNTINISSQLREPVNQIIKTHKITSNLHFQQKVDLIRQFWIQFHGDVKKVYDDLTEKQFIELILSKPPDESFKQYKPDRINIQVIIFLEY